MPRPDPETAKAIWSALTDDERAMIAKMRDSIKRRNPRVRVSNVDALEIVLAVKRLANEIA